MLTYRENKFTVPVLGELVITQRLECEKGLGSAAADIDIERCVCGGKLKIIAVIEEPAGLVENLRD